MRYTLSAVIAIAWLLLLPASSPGQTVEEQAWTLIRELMKDPEVVIVEDEVQAGNVDGPSGPHANYNVSTKLEPGTPEYEAKAEKIREKRRRDIQAKLVALGPPAVPTICSAVTNQSLTRREYFAEALEMIGDIRAAPCLIDYMNEGLGKMRLAETLEKQGETELAAAQRKEASLILKTALNALRMISGQDYGTDVAKWRAWWQQYKNYYHP